MLGWTSTKLGLMCLAQGHWQRSNAGEARTGEHSVSSQALYHWATALPPHSHSAIFTISVKKSHNAPAMSMRAPYEYLKSLRSFEGPNYDLNSCGVLTIICGARTGVVQSACDVYTGLRFFKNCHSAEWNKIVEATVPVNDWVSLRWPNLDIVRALQNCNWGIIRGSGLGGGGGVIHYSSKI